MTWLDIIIEVNILAIGITQLRKLSIFGKEKKIHDTYKKLFNDIEILELQTEKEECKCIFLA